MKVKIHRSTGQKSLNDWTTGLDETQESAGINEADTAILTENESKGMSEKEVDTALLEGLTDWQLVEAAKEDERTKKEVDFARDLFKNLADEKGMAVGNLPIEERDMSVINSSPKLVSYDSICMKDEGKFEFWNQ